MQQFGSSSETQLAGVTQVARQESPWRSFALRPVHCPGGLASLLALIQEQGRAPVFLLGMLSELFEVLGVGTLLVAMVACAVIMISPMTSSKHFWIEGSRVSVVYARALLLQRGSLLCTDCKLPCK